jgi:hypothetical protein
MGAWLYDHWFQVAVVFLLAFIIAMLRGLINAVVHYMNSATDDLSRIVDFLKSEERVRNLEEPDRIAHYRASVRRSPR